MYKQLTLACRIIANNKFSTARTQKLQTAVMFLYAVLVFPYVIHFAILPEWSVQNLKSL